MTTSLSAQIKRLKANQAKIITPRMDKWLIDHPEGITVPPEMMPLVQRLLSSPNANRSARFGASGRGRCQRRQVFDFLGMPALRTHDPVLQNLFNDGTWRHIRHQLMGMIGGWFTDVEVTHVMAQYALKVSTDGENTDEGWGFELKGMSWMKKLLLDGINDYHMGQIHTYFVATGFDRFVYLAENKQSNDWIEMVVLKDPKWMRIVKEELNALTDSIEDRKLPAILPACRAHKGEDFRGCPYSAFCTDQTKWPVKIRGTNQRKWED
jgi:hypothetical protein